MDPAMCAHCQTLTLTTLQGPGRVQVPLCARCTLSVTPCAAYAHAYRGTAIPGLWVCETCGQVLESQKIETRATGGVIEMFEY